MASISTLFDNFSAGSINTGLWTPYTSAGATVTQTGGKLVVTPNVGYAFSNYAGVTSVSSYDLTGSSVQVEVDSVIDVYSGASAVMFVGSAAYYVQIVVNKPFFGLEINDGSTSTTTSITYDPVAHKFWRVRQASGVIYIDTSPDGSTWTNRLSKTTGVVVTGTTVDLSGSTPVAVYSASYTVFDNVNFQAGDRTVSDQASGGGGSPEVSETSSTTLIGSASGGGHTTTLTSYQTISQKDYEYRVSDKLGNFISVWQNVVSDPEWGQSIGQNADELNVHIARSPDNRVTTQTPLQDTGGANILDTSGDLILTTTDISNSVGTGTDIDVNLYVDVYVFYGGYDALLDTVGDPILDTSGDPITSQFGFPNGKRVYSGYIADYELLYGSEQGVNVTIVPHATEQNHIVYKDASGNTTITWNSTDPVSMARNAMDRSIADGSIITYDSTSMPLSGEVASYEFTLQTTKECMDIAVQLLPYGYYAFVDVGERKQYILNKSATAHHTFYYEQHLTDLRLKRSITQMVNDVYFIGGEYDTIGHPGEDLFKHYTDASSIATYRRGLDRISDGRVTLASSAAILSQTEIDEFKLPRYRTPVVISDAVYDIETIQLGQMVAFANFGSSVDSLLLQIVTLHRTKHTVTLDLDMLVPSDAKRLEDIKRRINTEDVSNVATAPI